MEKHLKNIAAIISKFKKKYNFVEAYLEIKGAVTVNVHSHVSIQCNTEFDKLTMYQVRAIRADLYEKIRRYLENNKIDQTVYIETIHSGWAVRHHVVYCKTEVIVP